MSMLLLCVVIVLVTVGFVGPCVLDIAITPQRYFGLPSKRMWLVVAVLFWAFGAAAWLIAGRGEVRARCIRNAKIDRWLAGQAQAPARPGDGIGAGYPVRPARRARRAMVTPVRFVAPDDNPEFLLELNHRIQGWRDGR